MPTMWTLTAAALVSCCLPGTASTKATGAIDCPVQSLSAKQRADVGAALVDDQRGNVTARARDIIAKPAGSCANSNRWSDAQTETAITWSIWALMDAEERQFAGS